MAKIELSPQDEMDILESRFYPEAIALGGINQAIKTAKPLVELNAALTRRRATIANINFILDKWLDIRNESQP